MKKEDIEEAAGNYSGSILGFKHLSTVMGKHKAFVHGAMWRIEKVWHKELPNAQTKKTVLVKFTNGLFNLFEDIRELKGFENQVKMFAYIEDLTPTEEE